MEVKGLLLALSSPKDTLIDGHDVFLSSTWTKDEVE
jgi:hypothetical protein